MQHARTRSRRAVLQKAAAALLGPVLAPRVLAAESEPLYPLKVVRLVVPYPAGGGTDAVARAVGQKLSELWGKPVIVDNRPGANGMIGTELVVHAPPDGYTLLLVVPSHVVNPVLMSKLPYDTRNDLAPVTTIMSAPLVLVVAGSSPWHSAQQLVAEAKGRPGRLSIGNSEGSSQLTAELFKQLAGIDVLAVPYKGSAPMVTDLVGGHVSMGFIPITSALPQMKSGSLRAIGLASEKRLATLPELPTLKEQGVAVDSYAWTGVFAPAHTSPELLRKIQTDIAKVIAIPALRDRIGQGVAVMGGEPPEEFGRYVDRELEKWAAVARSANVKPE